MTVAMRSRRPSAARSRARARRGPGIKQFRPGLLGGGGAGTDADLAPGGEADRPGDNPFHIDTNLRLGCTIVVKHRLLLEGRHLARVLARYNGRVGQSWYPMPVFDALRQWWRPHW
jgi:hypothetical protein